MKQAIAGVAPPEAGEVTSMTVWPSIGAGRLGRFVGRAADVRLGVGRFFTVGKLLALTTIPVALVAYIWKALPFVCRRYRLTNQRVVVHKGFRAVEERAIGLDEFDAIEIQVRPGQGWLRSGDVIYKRDGKEVFRLAGVLRPDPFRQVCLKAQTAFVSVREVLQRQAAAAAQ
ncbi:MAG: PH domain-containing protein [Planctomycetota bacterium]|jgi:hypothetical protein